MFCRCCYCNSAAPSSFRASRTHTLPTYAHHLHWPPQVDAAAAMVDRLCSVSPLRWPALAWQWRFCCRCCCDGMREAVLQCVRRTVCCCRVARTLFTSELNALACVPPAAPAVQPMDEEMNEHKKLQVG